MKAGFTCDMSDLQPALWFYYSLFVTILEPKTTLSIGIAIQKSLVDTYDHDKINTITNCNNGICHKKSLECHHKPPVLKEKRERERKDDTSYTTNCIGIGWIVYQWVCDRTRTSIDDTTSGPDMEATWRKGITGPSDATSIVHSLMVQWW